ncbi:glycerol-3-phosphate dehydrogenase [Bradyrhizobium sp. USDA 4454]
MADYDVAIFGGGLNGTSIARDAAGRGLRVILLEQGDLGSGASQASPRLVHGDLAGLERRALFRVRTALRERDVLLRIAPHLVRPARFAIPVHAGERPAWQLRSLLLLYERLASRSGLPRSTTLDVTHHPVGNALKRPFGTAFEYSDCVVDDSRLVVLNAVDAAARGAEIRTGARLTRAERGDTWRLVAIDRGYRRVITARALVNATGAWTASVADTVLRVPAPPLATVQISQIVVRRLFDCDNVYAFQNPDGQLIFASPYERDFTLIGSVGHPFKGDPAIVAMDVREVAYLCDAANRYFREQITPADVLRTVSGANSIIASARWRRRDGAVSFDTGRGKAPLLTIFGGDVTTSRRRAERAVAKFARFYSMGPRWTATVPLPGGEFAWQRFETEVDIARDRWRFLSEAQARRLVAAYGLNVKDILGDAKAKADLGPAFGAELTGAEVRYLMRKEWARFTDDVLWRRSKLGLTMPQTHRDALAAFMAKMD